MEDILELYEAVFKRKSVRKFKPEPFSMSEMFDLQKIVENAEPLMPDIPWRVEVLTGDAVKGPYLVKAPHYLCLYSDGELPGARENAGYLLEQFVLYMTSRGLGTCWLGGAHPSDDNYLWKDHLPFMIMVAFGTPDENPYREEAYKRKPIDQITEVAECADLLEAVRLAPSAVNSQPWLITGIAGDLLFSRIKPGLLRSAIAPINQIDMGIALCHFRLAAAKNGYPIRISVDPAQEKFAKKMQVPKGHIFSARVTW